MILRSLRLLMVLCLLPLFAIAQARDGVFYISKDKVSVSLNKRCWRFTPSDLRNGADTALDDSRWALVNPAFYLENRDSKPEGGFEGIGWMRLHIMADSSVSNVPLALRVSHYGASRIYLDGRLVEEFGKPGSKDSVEYFDPQHVPIVLGMLRPGPHLLAVQYANWNWARYRRRFAISSAGFSAILGEADESIFDASRTRSMQTALLMALFGIFAALALIHFILYLFCRSERSNALFARFAVCMSGLFLLPVIMQNSHDPDTETIAHFLDIVFIAAACTSFSALAAHLLSKSRWPMRVIGAIGLLTLAFGTTTSWGTILLVALVVAAPLHVVVVVILAMRRRVPGARILGTGVLFFTLTLLYIIGSISITGDFSVNDSELSGKIVELTLMAAILAIPVSMSAYLSWRFATLSKTLKTQLTEVERLSAQSLAAEAEKQSMLQNRQQELEREVAERTASLRMEKQKSDDLLLNILPAEIAEELKEYGRSEARLYNDVSVLFTDFVGFTQIAESLSPAALVAEIDECFKAFDRIIEKHRLEKIKTVGDAYIAVSGMPLEDPAHARNVIAAALEIRDFMRLRKQARQSTFLIRLGVHSGPVVAGIVGVKKFAYDIWGDTVNTAARMEQHSEPGNVNISTTTYELVKDEFRCTYRGELEAKHKGKMGMYFVEGSLTPAGV